MGIKRWLAATSALTVNRPSVVQTMITRHLSGSAPITGNRRVMRSDSMRNSPMDTSTRMITRAAMSATRQVPMKLVPPTISAIGRAIRLKLITAPPIAIASTNTETKNCTSDDDDSMRSARSVCRSSRYPPRMS